MASAQQLIDRRRDRGPRPDHHRARSAGDGQGRNITQQFALIFGVTYLLVGVVGFAVTGFTGITSNGADRLLVFDLNVFHNIVHMAIGAGFIAVSRLADPSVTQGVVIGAGVVYLLAAALGFLDSLQILSIDSAFAADNFLHLFSGLAAVFFGLAGVRQSKPALQPA